MKQKKTIILFILSVLILFSKPPNLQAAELQSLQDIDLQTIQTIEVQPVEPEPKTIYFPVSVEETEENGHRKIIKSYALNDTDNPGDISIAPFEKSGFSYVFADVIKKELSYQETEDFTEVVTITAQSNSMDDILKTYNPIRFYDKDGYTGELHLDTTSITVEPGERQTGSYTVTKTRDYPHLSVNDAALVPKAIEENGKIYTLDTDSIEFIPQNTTTIDYTAIADSYKAVAKYTAIESSTKTLNYIVSAEYKGQISKTVKDKTYYDVIFLSTEQIIPEPTPEPLLPPVPIPEPEPPKTSAIPVIIAIVCTFLLTAGAFFMGYLFLSSKVKVFSHKDGLFIKIGRVSIDYKTNTIELDKLAHKAHSDNFILELPARLVNKLHNKKLTVNYKEKKLFHTVNKNNDMKKYQFQGDFTTLLVAVPADSEEQIE